MRIVPALDEVEDRHPRRDLGFESTAVEQLAFQGGKKAFAQGVVETVAHRTHRGAHASLTTTHPERDRGVLSALVGMMDYRPRPALPQRHVEGFEYQLGAQMIFHRPADHPAAERV